MMVGPIDPTVFRRRIDPVGPLTCKEFVDDFCEPRTGRIDWSQLVKFNSGVAAGI